MLTVHLTSLAPVEDSKKWRLPSVPATDCLSTCPQGGLFFFYYFLFRRNKGGVIGLHHHGLCEHVNIKADPILTFSFTLHSKVSTQADNHSWGACPFAKPLSECFSAICRRQCKSKLLKVYEVLKTDFLLSNTLNILHS